MERVNATGGRSEEGFFSLSRFGIEEGLSFGIKCIGAVITAQACLSISKKVITCTMAPLYTLATSFKRIDEGKTCGLAFSVGLLGMILTAGLIYTSSSVRVLNLSKHALHAFFNTVIGSTSQSIETDIKSSVLCRERESHAFTQKTGPSAKNPSQLIKALWSVSMSVIKAWTDEVSVFQSAFEKSKNPERIDTSIVLIQICTTVVGVASSFFGFKYLHRDLGRYLFCYSQTSFLSMRTERLKYELLEREEQIERDMKRFN